MATSPSSPENDDDVDALSREVDGDNDNDQDVDMDADPELGPDPENEQENPSSPLDSSQPNLHSLSSSNDVKVDDSSSQSYLDLLSKRSLYLHNLDACAHLSNYAISSLIALPHSTPVNALAMPPCFSHIFTGGHDGFIRRYGFHSSLSVTLGSHYEANQREKDLNLLMKQGGHTAGVVSGVLIGYWENYDPDKLDSLDVPTRIQRAKWAPRSLGSLADSNSSPVYSLAVHSQELWGLSGTDNGSINLFTIRHDEGQIRHVFPSSPDISLGHNPTSPVSYLLNLPDEKSFLSGGWDGRLLHWDLNTGQAIRNFQGHNSQISSISWRPLRPPSLANQPVEDDDENKNKNKVENDDEAQTQLQTQPQTQQQRPSSAVSNSRPTSSAGARRLSSRGSPTLSNKSFDPLFDEGPSSSESPPNSPKSKTAFHVAASLLPNQSKPSNNDTLLPEPSQSDSDVFLTTSIDGQAQIWDRRVKSSDRGGVRQLGLDDGTEKGWQSRSWCASGAFTASGNKVILGRRNASTDVYDIRKISNSIQTCRLPSSSGPVTCVHSLADDRHILIAAQDNIRIWDLEAHDRGVPFRIVPGVGGTISHICVDPTESFAVASSGGRGWTEGRSTDSVTILDIKRTPL